MEVACEKVETGGDGRMALAGAGEAAIGATGLSWNPATGHQV